MLLVSRFAFEPLVINEPFVVEIHFTNKSANKTIHGVQWNSSDIEPATDDLKLIKAHCETVLKARRITRQTEHPKQSWRFRHKRLCTEMLQGLLSLIRNYWMHSRQARIQYISLDILITQLMACGIKRHFCGFTDRKHNVAYCLDHNEPY
jgi:hypothetical protein